MSHQQVQLRGLSRSLDLSQNHAVFHRVLSLMLEKKDHLFGAQGSELAERTEQLFEVLASKSPSQDFDKETEQLRDVLLHALQSLPTRIDILRLLPTETALKPLVQHYLSVNVPLEEALPLLSALLQYTDAFNFSILTRLRALRHQSRALTQRMLSDRVIEQAEALVRCLQAQPYLTEVLDTVPIFQEHNQGSSLEGDSFSHLVTHLRQLVYAEAESTLEESSEQRNARLELVQSLLLNKRREERLKVQTELQINDSIIETHSLVQVEQPSHTEKLEMADGQVVAATPYVMERAQGILEEIERKPFGHFVVRGPSGSGKMTMIRLVDHLINMERASSGLSEPSAGKFIVVTLEQTFDSKNLVGTYVCNESGEFQFKKGPLTVAAEQGLWLVLRNIEDTPSDLLSFLLPLVEQNTLQVTSTFSIKPKLGFRIFALTRSQDSQQGFLSTQEETIAPLVNLLKQSDLDSLMPSENSRPDLESILRVKYEPLFASLQSGQTVHQILQKAMGFICTRFNQLKVNLLDFKPQSVTQMLSLYERVSLGLGDHLKANPEGGAYLSQGQRQLIIEEIHDVYLAYMYDTDLKRQVIEDLTSAVFNTEIESMDGSGVAEFITSMGRSHEMSNEQCNFGRAALPRTQRATEESKESAAASKSNFVYTGATIRSLEQICQSVRLSEAMLLVGETGTGKTTVVQELAKLVGKTLHVFNMNQSTDSSDLLGGFRPVDLKHLLPPVYRLFREVFCSLLNAKATNNAKFLELMQITFERSDVTEFVKYLNHGMRSIRKKKNRPDELNLQLQALEKQANELQKRASKCDSASSFIFQFVEGQLIKSIQDGDWILLDEINLASDSVLNKLATIVQGTHVLLNERADIVETKRHPEFRIFMCMNPPYSSAGKKQLPLSLRCKLTEVYVAELDNENDLRDIIQRYSKSASNERTSCLSNQQQDQVLAFYRTVKAEVQRQMRRSNIGLRNLCRALFFIKNACRIGQPATKAIYDSMLTCFASHLDQQLQEQVRQMIMQTFGIKKLSDLHISQEAMDPRHAIVEGNLIEKGGHPPLKFDETNFILTKSFKRLLRQLASVVAVSDFAVILEGPTSAGKTSCVQYLAEVTHNKVIRINNHMHTDVQEYLGSYVPDDSNKFVFQEGVLVEAVRNGYWVILDELNLAPSEVLEALNRLLDDNRELHIVETKEVIKAHPNFRIFATQNPTEGYGGRKELSEAFKNRFVLIRVLDVPADELKEILMKKSKMPESRATLMIKVMEQLQLYRSQANLFSGKSSVITVRDLLKWAGRVNQNNQRDEHMDKQAIATEGFFVLGERSRNVADKKYIQTSIEDIFKVKIDAEQLYEDYFEANLKSVFDSVPSSLNLPKIIPSKQLKRLAVLLEKCLRNQEPVLLVGETGCGKTTLCQVFAQKFSDEPLMQINCHQNTETSDFIGCMRTRKNLKQTQDELLALLEENAHFIIDEAAQASFGKARTLKRKTKVFLEQVKAMDHSEELETVAAKVKELSEDLNSVFEWHDGILVEAMQKGALLLIDEISLANDSVLERLNSVFEYDRVLNVTEKSSAEAHRIVAHEKFTIVATMNPSGDFGKKELSPALRNRMTEIWVESYFEQKELLQMQAGGALDVVRQDVPESVDLFLIISKLCEDARLAPNVALAIFNMINFLAACSQANSAQLSALKRKSLSIRDILCIIDFFKTNQHRMSVEECFREAIELVIVDGICLGIDTAGHEEQEAIVAACQDQISRIVATLFDKPIASPGSNQLTLTHTDASLGVAHYSLDKKQGASASKFAFNATTTQTNLMKLLRAYTLSKPILIEGPPGVGKTALVEQVAKVTGRKLVRVNLSEQTDMMDLLGSEYPTSASPGEDFSDEEDQEEIQFKWGDGVLLSAIKEGHWLLIDEMNLAQQSILEGLNAILDHRRTVYIPELNQEFQCHPDFFVFACQNPSQSAASTSGRKTLPKSFLNRFTKIYLNELTPADYQVILQSVAGEHFPDTDQIQWLLDLTREIELQRQDGKRIFLDESGVGVNMRDISRFLKVYTKALTDSQGKQDVAILHAFNAAYLMKEGVTDVKRHQCLTKIQESVLSQPSFAATEETDSVPHASSIRVDSDGMVFDGVLESRVPFSQGPVGDQNTLKIADLLNMKGPQAVKLQSLCDCLSVDLPVLLTTDDTTKMTRCLSLMAQVKNTKLRRILLSDRSDTTQLLGCFEQTSQDLAPVLRLLEPFKKQSALTAPIMELEKALSESALDLQAQIRLAEKFISKHSPTFDKLKPVVSICKKGASRFEWVDSVLIKAICEGEWAVFENANICNPSILDRLNPLLEEGNQSMAINEQGLDNTTQQLRTVQAHLDFRAIFVLSRSSLLEQGRDVSRALRNRCVEISVTFNHPQEEENTPYSGLAEAADDVAAEQIDVKNLDWSLTRLQTQVDMLPIPEGGNQESEVDEPKEVKLGKRTRKQQEEAIVQSLEVRESDSSSKECDSYPFIYLEKAPQMAGSEAATQQICRSKGISADDLPCNGQSMFLREKISHLQRALKQRLSTEIVTKQLTPLFTCLLERPSEDCDLESLHLLLSSMLKARGLSQSIMENTLSLYLALRQPSQKLRDSLSSLKDGYTALNELKFLLNEAQGVSSEQQMEVLRSLAANVVQQTDLDRYLDIGLTLSEVLSEQKVFMFKVSAPRLTKLLQETNLAHGGRVSLTMKMLSGDLDDDPRQATVILLNSEKEILPQEDMIKHLEDLDEPAAVLETPNLVVIPFDQDSKSIQGVVTSQSFLYESMCDLKDWFRLQQVGKTKLAQRHFRQTKLPVCLGLFQDDASSVIANQIALLTRPLEQEGMSFFEERLIEAVLVDQQTICVRDLPAFYACGSSIAYKLEEVRTEKGKQEARFNQHFQRIHSEKCLESPMISQVRDGMDALQASLDNKLNSLESLERPDDYSDLYELAKESAQGVIQSVELISSLQTEQIIQALIMLPLEVARVQNCVDFATMGVQSYRQFFLYHYKSVEQADQLTQPQEQTLAQYTTQLNQLVELQAESGSSLSQKQQDQLRPLLAFTNNLLSEVGLVRAALEKSELDEDSLKDIKVRCETILRLIGSSTQLLLPMFNNILADLFTGCLNLVTQVRHLCLALTCLTRKVSPLSLSQFAINVLPLQNQTGMLTEILRNTSQSKSAHTNKELHEKTLLWALKLARLPTQKATAGPTQDLDRQRSLSHIFDFFVRREVAKKLAEQRQENTSGEQVFHVPFSVRDQALPDFVGKAMDEWTKEDVARMEAEAEKEIETNFPSYFDEVQQQFFSGELTKDYTRDLYTGKYRSTSVSIESVFAEVLQVTKPDQAAYFLEYLRDRVDVVKLSLQADKFEQQKRSFGLDSLFSLPLRLKTDPQWQEDTVCLLRKMLEASQGRSKQIMNVTEVSLSSSYNFYHDAFPEEARIVYEPMQNLLIRLRDIVVRDGYESPLLNESMFLANYIITCFNSEQTPLMKLLTSMELLLTKLEEWESTYASKRLNSVEADINSLKMLIIRFRKIQILSWRNLLNWRKDKMIREDVMECCRLAHTIEKQVFDLKLYKSLPKGQIRKAVEKRFSDKKGKKMKTDNSAVERTVIVKDNEKEPSVEDKVFDLLDLFIRDSSLGVYQSRITFVDFLRTHFAFKLEHQCHKQPLHVKARLAKVINILAFMHSYYGQFSQKLSQTVNRLDSAAREKVKTLIDVGKWTVQKFTIVKNNIDKTHRQLNKACKDEEEALLQNVQSLVIASSRKKYANTEDQLLSIHSEQAISSNQLSKLPPQISSSQEYPLAKQIQFMTETRIAPLLPNGMSLFNQTEAFMERLSEVRALNKKHIQVRAYYDLLRFMKNQGLTQSSFDSTKLIQQLMINHKMSDYFKGEEAGSAVGAGTKTHFYRAYETFSMLQSAAQVDEHSHIKNAEVIRMQSFSRSLMLHMLYLNKQLVDIQGLFDNLRDVKPKAQLLKSATPKAEVETADESHLTEVNLSNLQKALASVGHLISDTCSRLQLLSLQESSDSPVYDPSGKKVTIYATVESLQKLQSQVDTFDPLETDAVEKLESFLMTFETKITLNWPSKHARANLICDKALQKATEIREAEIECLIEDAPMQTDMAGNGQFEKNVHLVEKLVKLCMQKLFLSLNELEDAESEQAGTRKASLTADNSVVNVNPEVPMEEAQKAQEDDQDTEEGDKRTSIEEMIAFAKTLRTVLADAKTEKLASKAKLVFALVGASDPAEKTRSLVKNSHEILEQLCRGIEDGITRIHTFLRSMAKFGYLSQRVFIHLIYQGFCGQEDKDDPDVEPPSDLEAEGEQDGCGLGDGKGGQNNITDQIEHEEQLEGLKDYESDQEDQQDEQDKDDKKDQGDDEEEDNDFEMKNDFDGDLDSEPEEKKPEDKKEDDEDDEMGDVDDMLDNQLWDQNMEDMEQKEKEEQEKEKDKKEEEREEIDLGERDLKDQNLMPQQPDDENMAEGDHDEQEKEEQKQQEQQEIPEQSGSEEAEGDDQEDEGERDEDQDGSEEENKNDIPLEQDAAPAEEDEKFSEEAKSDNGDSEKDNDAEKEDTEQAQSDFEEDQDAQDQTEDNQQDPEGDQEVDEVQQKADQAILDDEDIQGKDNQQDDEKKDEEEQKQANLKKQSEATQDQQQKPENKEHQAPEDDNQVSQADDNGTDLLFQMAKQLQQRQQKKREQKQEQQNKQKPEQEDSSKQQVEQPQMADNEDEKPPADQPKDRPDEDMANEYVHDEQNVEQIQGKLATDQLNEEDAKQETKDKEAEGEADDEPMPEDAQQEDQSDSAEEQDAENIERTKAQFKETGSLKPRQETKDDKEDDEEMKDDSDDQKDAQDLLQDYEDYLKAKVEQRMEVDESKNHDSQEEGEKPDARFFQKLDEFDYMEQKHELMRRFQEWRGDEREHDQSLQLSKNFKHQTQSVSSSLCEQLRIVLEPQLSQNLQGDFKTGKRLNMKKVISFIASHYRNDKIWLRRTLPSKRDYKILIAIDDSLSMREKSQGFFSLEAMVALTEALTRLEVGKVAVARIRDRMDLVHSFEDTYTAQKAGFIVSQFNFDYCAPRSSDSAMANFVSDANKLLDLQNAGNALAINCPFVIVLSDGHFNKDNARRYIREAKEKRYLYIFVILDKQQATTEVLSAKQAKSKSILNKKSALTDEKGRFQKMVPYLSDFPFDYYCIVGDTSELPNALGTILVQWFSMVSAAGGR